MAAVELHLNHLQNLNSFFLKQDIVLAFKDFFLPHQLMLHMNILSFQPVVMK